MYYTIYSYDMEVASGRLANESESDYMSLECARLTLLDSDDADVEIVFGDRPGWKRVREIRAYDSEGFIEDVRVASREVYSL